MRVASRLGASLTLILLTMAGCTGPRHVPADPSLVIKLRWVQGYPRETKSKVETGLVWGLSFLGAAMPAGAEPFSWQGNVIVLDLGAVGILAQTKPAWLEVLGVMKNSDEYLTTGAIDVGRFLTLTLCSSHQYLALTGAARSYAEFQAAHSGAFQQAAVVESDIALGNRLLQVSSASALSDIAFVAYEGTGAISQGTFVKSELETIDFMPNGQLRFALFDLQGNPKMAASPAFTAAGKPSKCLWCHEIRLQPPFKNSTSVPGYLSAGELKNLIHARMQIVDSYRAALKSSVDFRRTDDHTMTELLYLSFNEPSAQRLSQEWGISEDEVHKRLAGLKTHRQAEFSFLGTELYDRRAVDAFAPTRALPVPSQIREAAEYEPDLTLVGRTP